MMRPDGNKTVLISEGTIMDDLQIIEMYFARDQAAIAETDKKYGKLCMSVANAVLRRKEDSEECVNDTYLAAWNAIPPQRPEYFSAFLCKITRNLALKKYAYLHAKERNPDLVTPISELENILPDGRETSDEAEGRELGSVISRFLRSIPADERNIFIRKYILFDSITAIAKDFAFSRSKVKSMLARTRAKLGRYLKEYYGGKNE